MRFNLLHQLSYFITAKTNHCINIFFIFLSIHILTNCQGSKKLPPGNENLNETSAAKSENQQKKLTNEEVVISAKQFMSLYFDWLKEYYNENRKEVQEAYFNQQDFLPRAEFNNSNKRWYVWFSNSLPGCGLCIEMNTDATLGTLTNPSGTIILLDGDLNDPKYVSDPPLFTLVEFGQALRCRRGAAGSSIKLENL